MEHICNICGRKHECNLGDDCDYPETFPMNCGVDVGKPIHQEEYVQAVNRNN